MSEATSRKRRRGPSEASNDQPVDVGGAPDAADAVPEHPSVGQLAQQVLQMQSVLAASVQQMQMQQMQSVLAASMQQIDTRTARIESAVQQMQQQTAASVQQMEARINESIQQMEERVGRGVVAPPPQLQQTQQGAANETCGLPRSVSAEGGRGEGGPVPVAILAPGNDAVGVMQAAPRCPICHCRETAGLCALPCQHVFHWACVRDIVPGRGGRKTCPTCRAAFQDNKVLKLIFETEPVPIGPSSESGPPSEEGDAAPTPHIPQNGAMASGGSGEATVAAGETDLVAQARRMAEAAKRTGQAARRAEETGEMVRNYPGVGDYRGEVRNGRPHGLGVTR
eukprot:GHVU01196881.1.p1 GENE.GHVU01196881.1~~GHVU01196881.1.p1  ORF type:complete len:339 (+),score=62.75 GHVU01196881.1:127-1143(+)